MASPRTLVGAIMLTIFLNSLLAQQPKYSPTPPMVQIPKESNRKTIAIVAPKPEYPEYARKRHWTGVGWFVMHVDVKNGCVRSVEITQSTGHKILDDACVNALRRWRFKLGTAVPIVKTPITFWQQSEKSTQ